jgi:hypothetical protein
MAKRLITRHKEAEDIRIPALSNHALIYEALEAAAGDDYDGGFTAYGRITYDLLVVELQRRLLETKWIDKNIFEK